MKANREHRSRFAGVLRTSWMRLGRSGAGAGALVFTLRDGEMLDEKVLRRLLERLGVPAVPLGFRSSFRDWAAEETDHRREVIEAALAHVVQNKVEAGLREVGPVRAPATWGGGGPCVVHCDSRTIRVGPSWFVQN